MILVGYLLNNASDHNEDDRYSNDRYSSKNLTLIKSKSFSKKSDSDFSREYSKDYIQPQSNKFNKSFSNRRRSDSGNFKIFSAKIQNSILFRNKYTESEHSNPEMEYTFNRVCFIHMYLYI